MRDNTTKITGVLHQNESQQHYRLRRYLPESCLAGFVEQFWLVDWNLKAGKTHTQQNLPDPNFHLIIGNEGVRFIGPVSKVYAYPMKGKGRIIGVKFELGALVNLLNLPLAAYVDTEIDAKEVLGADVVEQLLPLLAIDSDALICQALQISLSPFVTLCSAPQYTVQKLVRLIKDETLICKVAQLSEYATLSPRMLQRYFKIYVGLSPKWLIRKYRLSQALEELDKNTVNILDIVEQLNYADQSHLIRDFKEMIGVTPRCYSLS